MSSVKNTIILAVIDLIESDPSASMSLEAIAARAGVSKGGLLHYFRTKKSLFMAVIEHMADEFEKENAEHADLALANERTHEDAIEAEMKAIDVYLDQSFNRTGSPARFVNALFAFFVDQPDLIEPMREYIAQRTSRIYRFSKNPELLTLVLTLADGLYLLDGLGLASLDEQRRQTLLASIKSLVRAALERTRSLSEAADLIVSGPQSRQAAGR